MVMLKKYSTPLKKNNKSRGYILFAIDILKKVQKYSVFGQLILSQNWASFVFTDLGLTIITLEPK